MPLSLNTDGDVLTGDDVDDFLNPSGAFPVFEFRRTEGEDIALENLAVFVMHISQFSVRCDKNPEHPYTLCSNIMSMGATIAGT